MAGTAYRTASHPYPGRMSEPSSPSPARIWTGLGVVYFFWGTTYLAIDRSNQTIPPLVGPAVRFCLAGAILMGWSRTRHAWRRPTARQWRSAAVVGCLLLLGGNGSVAVRGAPLGGHRTGARLIAPGAYLLAFVAPART